MRGRHAPDAQVHGGQHGNRAWCTMLVYMTMRITSEAHLDQRRLANAQLNAGVRRGHAVDAQVHSWQQVAGRGGHDGTKRIDEQALDGVPLGRAWRMQGRKAHMHALQRSRRSAQ
jgi:hypothetical protein